MLEEVVDERAECKRVWDKYGERIKVRKKLEKELTKKLYGKKRPRVEVSQVTDSVFCVKRKKYLSCSYIVKQDPFGVVLVDTGMDPTGADMVYGLEQAGAQLDDVRAILLTHWHNDHTAGTYPIHTLTEAPIYYHENDAVHYMQFKRPGRIRRGLARVFPDRGIFAPLHGLMMASPAKALSAEKYLVDGDEIRFDFECLYTPGHSSGHASYFFKPEGVLFTGDALAVCNDKVSFMSRFLTEDKEAGKESMRRCLEMEPRYLCPGHREPLEVYGTNKCQEGIDRLDSMKWWPIIGC